MHIKILESSISLIFKKEKTEKVENYRGYMLQSILFLATFDEIRNICH